MSELKIGSTKWSGNRQSGGGLKRFKIEDGSDYYRLLPPIHSLADSGAWYKYWRIHWGFQSAEGKPRPLVCIERKSKDGVVYERCPVCDMVENAKQELEHLKSHGASPEEASDFQKSRIDAFEAKGNYQTYAFNANNELGILALTKTMKDGFEKRGKELEAEGFEINGIEGVFVDIQKSGKGRYHTKYEVQIAMEIDPNNRGMKRYKTHTLTPELQKRIMDTTIDLANLHKPLTAEELSLVVGEDDPVHRAALVSKLTSRGEKSESKPSGYQVNTEVKVTGQNATFVARTELDSSKMKTSAPDLSKLQAPTPPKASEKTKIDLDNIDAMSDDDFMKAFEQRFKQ